MYNFILSVLGIELFHFLHDWSQDGEVPTFCIKIPFNPIYKDWIVAMDQY